MEELVKLAQIVVAISVAYVWIFRFDNVIKEFKMSEREMAKKLTAKGFFKRFFQKKVSFDVPSSILWDGTDKEGDPIISKSGSAVFEKSHWRTEVMIGFELPEDAVEYIADINAQLDLEDAREARKANREGRKKKSSSRKATNEVVKTEDVEVDEEVDKDDETLEGIFGSDDAEVEAEAEAVAAAEAAEAAAKLKAAKAKAAKAKHAEAFEICEYGAQPNEAEIRRLFPLLIK